MRGVKRTHEQYVEEIKALHGNQIKVVGKYISAHTPVEHKCNEDHRWTVKPAGVLSRGTGCPICAGTKKKTTEQFSLELLNLASNLKVVGPYEGALNTIKIKCLLCDFIWRPFASSILSRPFCPKCQTKSGRKRLTHYEFLNKINGNGYTPLEPYISASTPIRFMCLSGHTFLGVPSRLSCPICVYKRKPYKLGTRIVLVQGYENFALDFLLRSNAAENIKVDGNDKIPLIRYRFRGLNCWHKPDLLVGSKRIFEVKSRATIGLCKSRYTRHIKYPSELFTRLKAKAKAANSLGYTYNVLLVSSNGSVLKLPRGWVEWGINDLRLAYPI